MISGLILLWAWKNYKKDCVEIGKENLAVSWGERVFAWLACGFWGIDLVVLATVIQILSEMYK